MCPEAFWLERLGNASGDAFGRFSAKLLADFRPNFWPLFGQTFGRFSAKSLASFRPKPCPFFVQRIVHFLFCCPFFGQNFVRFWAKTVSVFRFSFLISAKFRQQNGGQNRGRKWSKNRDEKRTQVAQNASGLAIWAPRPRVSCGRFSSQNRVRFWFRFLVFGKKKIASGANLGSVPVKFGKAARKIW